MTQQLQIQRHNYSDLIVVLKQTEEIPKFLSQIIIDYLFDPTMQLIFMEFCCIDILNENSCVNNDIINIICIYVFGSNESNKTLCSFEIYHPGKFAGKLNGILTSQLHTCELTILFGDFDLKYNAIPF